MDSLFFAQLFCYLSLALTLSVAYGRVNPPVPPRFRALLCRTAISSPLSRLGQSEDAYMISALITPMTYHGLTWLRPRAFAPRARRPCSP